MADTPSGRGQTSLRGIIVLFSFALNPGHLDRVQQARRSWTATRSPPIPGCLENYAELGRTYPRLGGAFLFQPGTRPVNVTALVAPLGFCANRLCTGTEPAMQKPIATLAIGGLINSTLHAQPQSKDAAVLSYTP